MSTDQIYCHADLNYARDTQPVPTRVAIHDGRASNLPGWEICGFELMDFPSAIANWTDRDAVNGLHLDETETFLKRLTGCDTILFYPPLLRSPEDAKRQPDLAPVQFVHSDYTEGYRAMIENPAHPYHDILAPSMARAGVRTQDIANAARVLTLQCWRNIGPADMDYPLAFCDARTVRRDELAPIRVEEYGGLKTGFDSFIGQRPSGQQHNWYVFPDMTVDEVVLFRAYDSDRASSGEPFWTLHTGLSAQA